MFTPACVSPFGWQTISRKIVKTERLFSAICGPAPLSRMMDTNAHELLLMAFFSHFPCAHRLLRADFSVSLRTQTPCGRPWKQTRTSHSNTLAAAIGKRELVVCALTETEHANLNGNPPSE